MTEGLFEILRDRANGRGLVMMREGRLRKELNATESELRTGLKKLEESALIEILAPGPFLVLKLRIWPGKRENAPNADAIPYSYSFQSNLSQSKQLKRSNSYSKTEGTPSLLKDILDTLGESDPNLFRQAIEHYPESVIRTALARVRSAKSIHKNRTALFRYLLPRIAKENPSVSN